MRTIGLFSLLMVLILSGCNSAPQQPAAAAPEFKPTFPIQEVMGHVIMPAADGLWSSVETNVTSKGVEEVQPRTEDEWEHVRNYAVTLVEATNLLLIPGRHVAEPGAKAADVSELSPEQIEQRITSDPAMWRMHVENLHNVAMESVAAIDKKSPEAMIEAGDHLDKACEDCHLVYWYPSEKGKQ